MQLWEKNIRKVIPYVPGEQPSKSKMVKLNTNENPYPPSPVVKKALEEIKIDSFRLYPDPVSKVLIDALAKTYHLNSDQIFAGVGSDDVLAMIFMTCFNSTKPLLFPDITYSFYDVWADLFKIPYEKVSLDNEFNMVKEDYFKENGGIIFPNPNAPTGALESLEMIEEIIVHNQDVIVVIDEAYIDFGGESAIGLIEKYDNVLVVQTFSKSRSMAGMRIGYAFGNPSLIKYINDVKYSFNSYTMNQTALYLGASVLEDEEYFKSTVGKIINTREWVQKEMRDLGFQFQDSKANFIFATHESWSAKELFEDLKKADIYVRYFAKPRIDNYLRITIGTEEEMKELLSFLRNYHQ